MRARIAEADRAAEQPRPGRRGRGARDPRRRAGEAQTSSSRAEARSREDMRRGARQARARSRRATAATREVLRDGTELSGRLRELSDSLRSNAELLLRDNPPRARGDDRATRPARPPDRVRPLRVAAARADVDDTRRARVPPPARRLGLGGPAKGRRRAARPRSRGRERSNASSFSKSVSSVWLEGEVLARERTSTKTSTSSASSCAPLDRRSSARAASALVTGLRYESRAVMTSYVSAIEIIREMSGMSVAAPGRAGSPCRRCARGAPR